MRPVGTIVVAAAIGAVTGACVAGAWWIGESVALDRLQALPGAWPALVTPLALLATLAVSLGITRAVTPATAELYIETYVTPGARLPLTQIPGRIAAALTTVGFGGSQGLESPSALIGAGWSGLFARWRGVDDDAYRTLIAAGASAGLAAVFASPTVGALYGIEVPYRRGADFSRLGPCAVAAGVGFLVRRALVGERHLVTLADPGPIDVTLALACLGTALACGVGARLFAAADAWIHRSAHGTRPLTRAIVGAALLPPLAWAGWTLSGAWVTFGPGYIAADWLAAGPRSATLVIGALAVRTASLLACVYGGGGGGVFTSLACMGTFIGALVAEATGLDDGGVLALVGSMCFLGAGYRLPIAAALYVAEQSASPAIALLGAVAVAIAYFCMGDATVSDAQIATPSAGR